MIDERTSPSKEKKATPKEVERKHFNNRIFVLCQNWKNIFIIFSTFQFHSRGWVRCVHNLLFFGYEIDTHRNTACFRKEEEWEKWGIIQVQKGKFKFFSSRKSQSSSTEYKIKLAYDIDLKFFFSSSRRLHKNSWKIHNWGKFLYKSRIIFDIFGYNLVERFSE